MNSYNKKLHKLTGKIQLAILSLYKSQSFQPTFAGLLINPFFLIRRPLFLEIKQLANTLNGELLDFGCGRKPYENLFSVKKYTGIDVEVSGHDHINSKVDVFYDGKTIPFPDESFDSVICLEVLEHVFNPDEILKEINRVLKPGAQGIISVPFCWNEHEVPYDFARYSSFGITHILEKNGFTVKNITKTGSSVAVILQLIILILFENLKSLGKARYVFLIPIIIPINFVGWILALLPGNNPVMYFNNVVLFSKSR